MATPMRIAVAGATGRLGPHVVDVARERGHDVVAMSRGTGVDVVTGEGLAEALAGVECIVDAATGASPDQQEATRFFEAAARNLHAYGERAGVRRMVEVSIIGVDRAAGGYSAAKLAHEQAMLAGPVPVRILRAAQFFELVPQLIEWGRQGDVAYVTRMRTQPVAARAVAEALVDLATDLAAVPAPGAATAPVLEIAGPREEDPIDMATRYAARRGDAVRIEGVSDPADPDRELNEGGGLLPGPGATLAGVTWDEWLDAEAPV